MKARALGLALAGGLLAAGCYTPRYVRTVRVFGEFDPARDLALAEQAEALPWHHDYGHVKVVAGALPDGLRLVAGGDRIEVAEQVAGRYQVLGSVQSITPAAGYRALYWTYPMHDGMSRGRAGFCAAQAPLRLVTLAVWSVAAPFNWPCIVRERPDGTVHLRELQRSAAAMGGNLVIVHGVDDVPISPQPSGAGNFLDGARVSAYVLRDRASAP